jgi:hypothetical protein
MRPLEWSRRTARYGTFDEAFIGKVKVGYVCAALGRQGEETQYAVRCTLPDIAPKKEFAVRPSVEEAKVVVEALVRRWFKKLEEEKTED